MGANSSKLSKARGKRGWITTRPIERLLKRLEEMEDAGKGSGIEAERSSSRSRSHQPNDKAGVVSIIIRERVKKNERAKKAARKNTFELSTEKNAEPNKKKEVTADLIS